MPKRVMIVDDDDIFVEELRGVLVLSGYRTVAFTNGTAALKWARTSHPDLILLDIKMDGMNGFQLSRKLKNLAETADIPIIAMTGHFTQEQYVKMMQECGMETCLKKPFNALDLLTRMELVLGLKRKEFRKVETGKSNAGVKK